MNKLTQNKITGKITTPRKSKKNNSRKIIWGKLNENKRINKNIK